ncbi:acyl-CoA thioesterase, partial [Flavobacteriaceae bacterium]|nr:acyl-CoA thioesterase [Flavobacteriaceae bacterium]
MLEYASKPLLVRYGETDQMGIVHHSNYFRYFEVARLEWLTALGVSYALMEKEGVIMPVIDAKISYKTPALFDDKLIINIFLSETPRVKIKFTYEVKN